MRALADAGPGLDPRKRERWLDLALGWLRDELASWDERVGREPARSLADVQGAIEVLQLCDEFGAIRDRTEPALRSERRRVAWQTYWDEAAALRGRCERLRRELIESPVAPVRGGEGPKGRRRDEL